MKSTKNKNETWTWNGERRCYTLNEGCEMPAHLRLYGQGELDPQDREAGLAAEDIN